MDGDENLPYGAVVLAGLWREDAGSGPPEKPPSGNEEDGRRHRKQREG
jgi:hypothetical protein